MVSMSERIRAVAQQATTAAKLPPEPRNPLQEALENYQLMRDELAAVKADLTVTKDSCVALMAENNELHKAQTREGEFFTMEVTTLRRERDMYMRFSMELVSRLKVIKENIIEVESGAQAYAARLSPESMAARAENHEATAPDADDEGERDPKARDPIPVGQRSAKDIIAALPNNWGARD
jgi:hypothetical protein